MFTVTARTVLELGAELISSDVIAFYELIKNGFDAGSKNGVAIRFETLLTQKAAQAALRIKVDSVAVLKENVEEALEHNAPKALVEAFTGELAKAKTLSAAQAIVSRAPSK